MKWSKYLNGLYNVDFIYADINCRLKNHFSNKNESFFDSMYELISKLKVFLTIFILIFLVLDLTVIFTNFCFKMISLSEVSMKKIL